ncbi:MAG TPA: hypothetical protein VNH22_19100 [Blastocatellia bacterium]|jgi:hypothetical protein|nr:hypothetical protein [Blastocatellia bacterium]
MEAADRTAPSKREVSPEEIERLRLKKSLLLSRQGVLASLEASRNPRYTKLLRDALVDLDEKLARLE